MRTWVRLEPFLASLTDTDMHTHETCRRHGAGSLAVAVGVAVTQGFQDSLEPVECLPAALKQKHADMEAGGIEGDPVKPPAMKRASMKAGAAGTSEYLANVESTRALKVRNALKLKLKTQLKLLICKCPHI